jgi:amino acid transporter
LPLRRNCSSSGGIYGNEGLLLLAPAAVVVLTLTGDILCFFSVLIRFAFCLLELPHQHLSAAVAVLFAVPLGLIVTEMGTAMPDNGGVVAWINTAFPAEKRAGKIYFVSSTLSAVSYIVDSAIYPTMASGYITKTFLHVHHHRRVVEIAIAQGIIVVVTLLQCLGTHFLSSFSNALALISLAPSLLWLVWGSVRDVNDSFSQSFLTQVLRIKSNTLQVPHMTTLPLSFPPCNTTASSPLAPADATGICSTDWAALLSWCLWLFNG